MSIYVEISGTIRFKDAEAKRKAVENLLKGGWVKPAEEGGYVWLDELGEAMEHASLIDEDDLEIVFDAGTQRNIGRPVAKWIEEGLLDEEKTRFRSVCFDGDFDLAEWRKDKSGKWIWQSLNDDEIFAAIGVDPNKISYDDEDEMEEGCTHYVEAETAANDWVLA